MEQIRDILKRVHPPTPSLPLNSEPALEDSMKISCPICQDAHWVYPVESGRVDYSKVVRCKCVLEKDTQERQSKLLKYCQLPTGSDNQTIESFKDRNNPTLREAKIIAADFAIGNTGIKWLTLIGKTDLGKSHLAKGIAREWLKRGIPAKYGFVPDLLLDLKSGFEQKGEESFESRMEAFKNIPLLVLDDLGTEKMTDWALETIQTIINHRYENQLNLVVTSNRPIDSILGNRTQESALASQRIASRLQREAWCKVLILDAPRYDGGRKC